MRLSIIITFLIPAFAMAAPKDYKTFMELSLKSRSEIAKEKIFEKKSLKLKDLEKDFKSAMSEYEKSNPTEGDTAEEKVTKFFFSMEPVFKLASGKKPSSKDCEKTRQQIDLEDRGSRGENAPLTPDAEEALAWVQLICN
ncbi:hypothetical protein [Bdellovibrio sp. HCB337]|uniref:hypothetical protein n=1 Tax=Bdellovibrio sp. HCB337 TaxID=3394358 RepID=UPI0039A72BEF